jgi:enediyne biosynthesis protein E4
VRGTAAGKERVWVNEVRSGSSYNSSSDMRLHFGLGPSPVLKEIEVSWPSGLTEVFPAPPVDRIAPLTEGAGKPLAMKSAK